MVNYAENVSIWWRHHVGSWLELGHTRCNRYTRWLIFHATSSALCHWRSEIKSKNVIDRLDRINVYGLFVSLALDPILGLDKHLLEMCLIYNTWWCVLQYHCNDIIMGAMASQITTLTVVYLCRRRSKNTSKLRVTGLCEGNSPVTGEFPAQMASNAENISIWWSHYVQFRCI